ncbi:MAG: hypothetical protein MET45_08935 [Nostoc sp. LLA-1]|nr:hypothetical protein [Cyanocohniella sp. LLY]
MKLKSDELKYSSLHQGWLLVIVDSSRRHLHNRVGGLKKGDHLSHTY